MKETASKSMKKKEEEKLNTMNFSFPKLNFIIDFTPNIFLFFIRFHILKLVLVMINSSPLLGFFIVK